MAAAALSIAAEQRAELERIAESLPHRQVLRARGLLWAGDEVLRRAAAYLSRRTSREKALPAEADRANALFDAHRDDPEFVYRFLIEEASSSGERMRERTAWRICRDNA